MVIYGFGGGKISDMVKVVVDIVKLLVVIMLMLVFIDVLCLCLLVIYKEDGMVENYCFYDYNLELVLVDS